MTASNLQSSAKPLRKSDNQWETILSECSSLALLWNRGEKWIKRAELVQQRVVDSSINELRYAGRLLVDALACANKKDFDKALEHIQQAKRNVYNASHDAIDAVVGFISREMNRYENDLDSANMNDHFRHYQELSGTLTTIKGQIEQSRQARDQRDEFYHDVAEGSDFGDLLRYFSELKSSIPAIHASIAKKKRDTRILRLISAGSLAATVALLLLRFLGI